MIDTDLSLFLALVLIVVLIVFDLAFYRFRQSRSDLDDPNFSILEDAFSRIKAWFASRTQPAGSPSDSVQSDGSSVPSAVEHPVEESAGQPVPDRPMVHVDISADIPEGTVVYITLEARDGQGQASVQKNIAVSKRSPAVVQSTAVNVPSLSRPAFQGIQLGSLKDRIAAWPRSLEVTLFIIALVVYLCTRFVGLNQFPIYFFTDEAVQTVQAGNLVANGFKGPDGVFLPTYFQNGTYFNLSVSVYAQVLPYLLFGYSVWVTRGTSVLITLLAAVSVSLILRDFLKAKYWWVGTLLLAIAPAWFIHSRTAFETAIFASIFAATIYFYLLYRFRSPNYLYVTLILAALDFYSYSAGQLVIAATIVVVAIVDWRYHWQNRKMILFVLALGLVLAAPYIRFRMQNSFTPEDHLRELDSYWIDPTLTLNDKIFRFFSLYAYGLSPAYWFIPNNQDLPRHIMLNYGHLMFWTLPFYLVGLGIAIWKLRSAEYRTVLIALLATPMGTALVDVGITRTLAFVIPATILTGLGFSLVLSMIEDPAQFAWIAAWQEKQNVTLWKLSYRWTAIAAFSLLAIVSIAMTRDALVNGPTWFSDYSLYGMQYGSQQVFQDTIRPALAKDPTTKFVVSPSWANGTEQFVSFFIPPALQQQVQLAQPSDLLTNLGTIPPNTIFISTSDEYNKLLVDPAYTNIKVLNTLLFPNGSPGFYELTLSPAANVQQILQAQRDKNRKPVEDTMQWRGQTVRVLHSPLGSGQLSDIFDDDPNTLARVLEANPYVLDIYLQTPISTKSLFLKTGSLHNYTVTVRLYAPNATDPVVYTQTYQDQPGKDLPPDPEVTIPFDNGPATSIRIEIEVLDNTSGDTSQIHIRTIQFK